MSVVESVVEKISDGRPADSASSSIRMRTRLPNLLAVLRRHQRKIQNDASLLESASPASETPADTNSIVAD